VLPAVFKVQYLQRKWRTGSLLGYNTLGIGIKGKADGRKVIKSVSHLFTIR
jgi:hypothetical protein